MCPYVEKLGELEDRMVEKDLEPGERWPRNPSWFSLSLQVQRRVLMLR